jgi:hypothetical protein
MSNVEQDKSSEGQLSKASSRNSSFNGNNDIREKRATNSDITVKYIEEQVLEPVLDAWNKPMYDEYDNPIEKYVWKKYICRKIPGTLDEWTKELVPTAVIENEQATEEELTEFK